MRPMPYKLSTSYNYSNIHAHIGCSYTIALSGLFELYTRGGHLNHEAKPSDLKAHLECTIKQTTIRLYIYNKQLSPRPQ